MSKNYSECCAAAAVSAANGQTQFTPCGEGGCSVSIVRIGMAQTKDFAEGYAAIFGNKKATPAKKAKAAAAKSDTAKKKRKTKKK